MSLYVVKAVIILESNGRLVSKYFVTSSDVLHNVKMQESFEKKLQKAVLQNAEIVNIDNNTVVYKSRSDITLCVVGDSEENELLLLTVLNTLKDTLEILIKDQIDKQKLLENLDYLLLTIDELVDGGVFMESEASQIAHRVALKGEEGEEEEEFVSPITEETVTQVVNAGVDYAKYFWNAFTQ